MENYRLKPITKGTSENLRQQIINKNDPSGRDDFIDEKGEDFPPTNLSGQFGIAIERIVGGSVTDLRGEYDRNQRDLAAERYDHESDSDSDDEVSDRIRYLAEEDTTWFRGCGFKFTLDSSILATQIIVGSIIIIFCILKLWSTNDCSVMSTYAPLLSAIVMYFLSNMGTRKRKNKKNS